jgi:hypothetical protein
MPESSVCLARMCSSSLWQRALVVTGPLRIQELHTWAPLHIAVGAISAVTASGVPGQKRAESQFIGPVPLLRESGRQDF